MDGCLTIRKIPIFIVSTESTPFSFHRHENHPPPAPSLHPSFYRILLPARCRQPDRRIAGCRHQPPFPGQKPRLVPVIQPPFRHPDEFHHKGNERETVKCTAGKDYRIYSIVPVESDTIFEFTSNEYHAYTDSIQQLTSSGTVTLPVTYNGTGYPMSGDYE